MEYADMGVKSSGRTYRTKPKALKLSKYSIQNEKN